MRRIFVGLAVLLSVAAAHAQQNCPQSPNFDCRAPACGDVAVPYTASPDDPTNTPCPNTVRIFLPDGYDAADTATRYPVLYLLHGAGDDYTTWSNNTDVFALTRGEALIVVMPNGGKNANAGWYSDWFDGSRHWEEFHIGDLVPYVDAHYDTITDRKHRAVAGLSMGGFGAMHYAARYPDSFGEAASFSGAVDMLHGAPASGLVFDQLHGMFGTPDDRVWGNQLTDEENWEANNPASLAAKLKNTAVFLATGDGLPGAAAASPTVSPLLGCSIGSHDDPSNPGGYALENGIFQMNVSFIARLAEAGVAHTDCLYPGGLHSWPYWQDDLHWALPLILDAMH